MVTWTGQGALSFIVILFGVCAGMVGFDAHDGLDIPFALGWFSLCMVAASLINQALATRLNGVRLPGGGYGWPAGGGPHTLWSIPMQSWTPVPLALGIGVLAFAAWVGVAPWAGIAALIAGIALWMAVKALWRRRPARLRPRRHRPAAPPRPVPGRTAPPSAPPLDDALPSGRPDGDPWGPDRPKGPRDWEQTDASVTWMRPSGSAGAATGPADPFPYSGTAPAYGTGRPGTARRSTWWRIPLLIIGVLIILPLGRAVGFFLEDLDSRDSQAPVGGAAGPGETAPDGSGDGAPVQPGWAHAGGTGESRHTVPRVANLCDHLDLQAMARTYRNPIGLVGTSSNEEAAGGVSLLCEVQFLSETEDGETGAVVTTVTATYAGDPAAASRHYDETWASVGTNRTAGEEIRDPDSLGESAFGFALPGGESGAAVRYLVSVLDSNLVLTVDQRVFGPGSVDSEARSRTLARTFKLMRDTIPKLT